LIGRRSAPPTPDARHLPKGFECVEEVHYPAVSRVEAIGGDVFSDLIQIEIRIDRENVVPHPSFE
jgi:hypothetical protein